MVYEEPSNKTISCASVSKPHYSVWSGNNFVSELKESVHRRIYHTNKKRMMEMAEQYAGTQFKRRACGEAPQWNYPWPYIQGRHEMRFRSIDKGIQLVDEGNLASDRKMEYYYQTNMNNWKAMRQAIEGEVASIVRPNRIS